MASLIFSAMLSMAVTAHAASPYDDYYDSYQQPDADPTQSVPVTDNDSYYTAPGQYPTDNDAYYSAPGTYAYPQAPSSSNCNTIGDVPSCGAN